MGKPVSLAEFARARGTRKGRTCAVCLLPQIKDIDEQIRNGLRSPVTIHAWLVEVVGNETVTQSNISSHIQRRHYEA